MSLAVASLHVYPIKSLGGFMLNEAHLTDRGFEHDRRWMLVDEAGVFVTQREAPEMACLHLRPKNNGSQVVDIRTDRTLDLPWTIAAGVERMCSVWSDRVRTVVGDEAWSAWFSECLGRSVTLVHMPMRTRRRVDGRYAQGLTSLSDSFPYLIISQASLDELNGRSEVPVGMDRFRPNIVLAGGHAFQEDTFAQIRIGDVRFHLVKPCARCVIVTTDQRTGERGKEPLRTLATYRSSNNKVLFGMNAMGDGDGIVRVGDEVTILAAG